MFRGENAVFNIERSILYFGLSWNLEEKRKVLNFYNFSNEEKIQ